jgi:hypothetical protein
VRVGPDARSYAQLGYRALVFNFRPCSWRPGDGPFAGAARALYGAAGTRDKQLLVLSSNAHGTNLLSFGDEGGKAQATLRGFITAHMGR